MSGWNCKECGRQAGTGPGMCPDQYINSTAKDALDCALFQRDAALARAEQAERERDEARAEVASVTRALDVYLADGERERARAAVVVWGQWAGVLGIDHDGDSWALVVSRGEPESNTGWDVEEFAFPRTCDDILRDIPDHAVDAIAATHGCPESLRVGWEGVRS